MGYAVAKRLILFSIMGFVYYIIEILWRGYSYWQMFIVGGICGLLIGETNEYLSWGTPLWKQGLIGDGIILLIEFMSGCVLNLWLGLNIWDYSNIGIYINNVYIPLNLFGQICLPYAFLWYFVSLFGIVLDDILRWLIFKEEFKGYKIF